MPEIPHEWRFSDVETIWGQIKKQTLNHNPRMLKPSSSSK